MKRFALIAIALFAAACGGDGCTVVGGKVTCGGVCGIGSTGAFRGAFPIAYTTATNGATPTVYTRPFYVPSDVAAVVPLARNAYGGGPVGSSFSSNLALYKSDGTGAPTGTALQTWAAQTIPGDGTDWSGGSVSITRGTDGKIVFLESLPANQLTAIAVTTLTHGTYSANTATVSPPPAPTASDPSPIGWIHFDYNTTKRRIIVIGDSISAGVNSSTGFEISFPYQLMVLRDYAVAQLSLPGSQLVQWQAYASTSAAWWADGRWFGADVWIQVGVNDITGNIPSALEGWFTTIVQRLRAIGAHRIYANTIAPNNATNESTRTAYNAWLRANSLNLDGIADFAAAQSTGGLADNSTGAALYSTFDSGDHLHWSDAGQTQAATQMINTVM